MQAKQETTRESDASPLTLTVSVVSSISLVSAEAWDLCALEAAGPESVNPFVAHAFLSSLEDSKSAVAVSAQTLAKKPAIFGRCVLFSWFQICLKSFTLDSSDNMEVCGFGRRRVGCRSTSSHGTHQMKSSGLCRCTSKGEPCH